MNTTALSNARVGRRSFLVASLSSGLLAQSPAMLTSAAPSLTMLTPTDGPALDDALAAFFPFVTAAPGFPSQIRPYLVVLRNDTKLVVKGYDVRWTVEAANGNVTAVDNYFVQKHKMPRRDAKILLPGDIRLLSFYENLAPGDPPTRAPYLSGGGSVATIALDGVVFEGGIFVGANQSMIKERYVTTRYAEHDAAVIVNRMLKANTPVRVLITNLQVQANSALGESAPNREALYERARALEAGRLLAVYSETGLPGLLANVARRVNFPREPASLALS